LELATTANDRRDMRIEDDALNALASYSFPGNVRELKNLIERLVILTPDDVIRAEDVKNCLPGGTASKATGLYRPGVPFRVLVEEAERVILQDAMAHHGGQMAATARALDLERSHLYKKTRALGLRGGEKGEAEDE
jgi:DNA-binding NtrC family response regulator